MRDIFALFILRIGLAFVFLYAGIASLCDPSSWIGYLPQFLRIDSWESPLLVLLSIIQIALGSWLFTGKFRRLSAGCAALMLAGIIVSNMNILDVVFRDIGLFTAAVALASFSREQESDVQSSVIQEEEPTP